MLNQRKIAATVPKLLKWFSENARDLPWRRTRDPYAIYVSEIMLQQTQVKTVIPYWTRWMEKLPDIKSLAAARPALIHKLWEGLGYYTRVRNMQKAAQVIMVRHRGKFPDAFEDLLHLPGVGRYTAGAVCSIAFNQPRPVLDGNVTRVLTRLFGVSGDPRRGPANDRLWALAQRFVETAADIENSSGRWPPGGCRCLNQALMELGALVCKTTSPSCTECPVRGHCLAFRARKVDQFPVKRRRPHVTRRHLVAFVIECNGRLFLRQRPEGTVNGHLWEFPSAGADGEALSLRRLARQILGFVPAGLKPLSVVRHSVTRYRMTTEAFTGRLGDSALAGISTGRWLTPLQITALALSSAHKRIFGLWSRRQGNDPPSHSETAHTPLLRILNRGKRLDGH